MKQTRSTFRRKETFERISRVVTGLLACFGRATITNSIMFRGDFDKDWSQDYRVFSEPSWEAADLFIPPFRAAMEELPEGAPVEVALDDTCLPKTGKKIPQARWCHDPLAPKFTPLPIQWGLRMLHAAIVLPHYVGHRPYAISIGFEPVPAAPKLKSGVTLTEEEEESFEAFRAESSLPERAVKLIHRLRRTMDDLGHADRVLIMVVDGSYMTGKVVEHLPDRTIIIGRFRKNACLFAPLKQKKGKRIYGEALPTPEQIRADRKVRNQTGEFHFGGGLRLARYKEVKRVLWKGTHATPMRLLIVMPLPRFKGMRKNRGYTQPAYLLTNELSAPASELIQSYFNRWMIECLHKDLKSGVGVGDVQAFGEESNERVHTATVAAYSMLLVAGLRVYGGERTSSFPVLNAWRRGKPPTRLSMHDLMCAFRNGLALTKFFRNHVSKPKGYVLSRRELHTAA
ncbi:MAG: transposase [Holophagaceae bacterium]